MMSYSEPSEGCESETLNDSISETMHQSMTVNPASPTDRTHTSGGSGGAAPLIHPFNPDDIVGDIIPTITAPDDDVLLHVGTRYDPSGSGSDSGLSQSAYTTTPPHHPLLPPDATGTTTANAKRPRALSDALSEELEEMDKIGQEEKKERIARLRKVPRLGISTSTSVSSPTEAGGDGHADDIDDDGDGHDATLTESFIVVDPVKEESEGGRQSMAADDDSIPVVLTDDPSSPPALNKDRETPSSPDSPSKTA